MIALLAATLFHSESTAAELFTADVDGWHTWRSNEALSAKAMCCFTMQRGKVVQTGCSLDSGHVSYGNHGDCPGDGGTVNVGSVSFYALIEDGKVAKIRTLSSSCPVTAGSDIRDHGIVSAKDNVEWFQGVIENRGLDQQVREQALFGLVQSESDAAFEYLDGLLSRH